MTRGVTRRCDFKCPGNKGDEAASQRRCNSGRRRGYIEVMFWIARARLYQRTKRLARARRSDGGVNGTDGRGGGTLGRKNAKTNGTRHRVRARFFETAARRPVLQCDGGGGTRWSRCRRRGVRCAGESAGHRSAVLLLNTLTRRKRRRRNAGQRCVQRSRPMSSSAPVGIGSAGAHTRRRRQTRPVRSAIDNKTTLNY